MRRIQYRFALDTEGRLVDVNGLVRESRRSAFTCIGCGARLVAHLKDDQRARHFAHFGRSTCAGYETYLHRASKAAFLETYRACLKADRPFMLRVPVVDTCNALNEKLGITCAIDRYRDIDLTQWFKSAAMEQRHDGFIADILLSGARARDLLLVEIVVTHPCDEAKIASGHRILEVRITSDEDIADLRSEIVTVGVASGHIAHNFHTRTLNGAFCGGKCPKRVGVFVVHRSGRAKLFEVAAEKANDFKPATAVWRRVLAKFEDAPPYVDIGQLTYIGDDLPPGDSLFQRAAMTAISSGVPVRTCEVCRRQGSPSLHGVWCFAFREQVHPSRAIKCPQFAPVRSVSELTRLRQWNQQARMRRLGGS